MRKRKRQNVTWFPTIGASGGVAVENDVCGRPFQLSVTPNGSVSIALTPLTFDVPAEAEDVPSNEAGVLNAIVGNEYVIKRIVGKICAGLEQDRRSDNDPSTPIACLMGAGFFVARAGDGADSDNPIGGTNGTVLRTSYNPLHPDCIREPWMWRRTWMLGNQAHNVLGAGGSTVASGQGPSTFPKCIQDYGDGYSGGHIDVKSSRRVSQDDRLWFVVAVTKFPIQGDVTFNEDLTLDGYLDYRILGSLRKARNNGNF